MSELFDSSFLSKLERLVITTKMTLADGGAGNRKSRSKGSSVEFSDYREYSIGDDFRRIDWNAYGRFEKLFIKLFMEEREAPVNIFLDTSLSMDWGSPGKSITSRRLAAALAYISLCSYDKVTLACLSNKVDSIKMSLRGKKSFSQVLDFLENVKYEGVTDMYAAISGMNMNFGRGISIIISDLFSKGDFEETIKYLQFRKQDIYVCHVLAPQEIEPSINEGVRLIDSETGEYMDVTASPLLIKTYKKVYDQFISDIEKVCSKKGVHYMLMNTATPVEQLIRKVSAMR